MNLKLFSGFIGAAIFSLSMTASANLDPSALVGIWTGKAQVKNASGAIVCKEANIYWKIVKAEKTLTLTSSSNCPENNTKSDPNSYSLGFKNGKLTLNLGGVNIPSFLSPVTGSYTANSISIKGWIPTYLTLTADIGPIEGDQGNIKIDIQEGKSDRVIIEGLLKRAN